MVSTSAAASPASRSGRSSANSSTLPQWTNIITLDFLLRILHNTILHPFIAWLIPLCLRAQAAPYTHPSFIVTSSYAALLTLIFGLSLVNKRLAYGLPRKVDFSEEVVVVVGGASGLGLLIAEIYGIRGVSVAVLDIKDTAGENGMDSSWEELSSVQYYTCDVGDRKQVEDTARRIEAEVRTDSFLDSFLKARPCLTYAAIYFSLLAWLQRIFVIKIILDYVLTNLGLCTCSLGHRQSLSIALQHL